MSSKHLLTSGTHELLPGLIALEFRNRTDNDICEVTYTNYYSQREMTIAVMSYQSWSTINVSAYSISAILKFSEYPKDCVVIIDNNNTIQIQLPRVFVGTASITVIN